MTTPLHDLSAAVRAIGSGGDGDDRLRRTAELARRAELEGLAWIALHLHEQRVSLGGVRDELIEGAERIAAIAERLHRPPHEIAAALVVRPTGRNAR